MTSIATVHELLAGIVPPVSESEFAVDDGVPPQVVAMFGVVAVTRPAGYVSVNATPVIAAALAFVSVIVRRDVPPASDRCRRERLRDRWRRRRGSRSP